MVTSCFLGTRTADRSLLGGEGEKYIAVTDQGTLHIYGEEKLAWTKLSQTVPANTYSGPYEYRHMVRTCSHIVSPVKTVMIECQIQSVFPGEKPVSVS